MSKRIGKIIKLFIILMIIVLVVFLIFKKVSEKKEDSSQEESSTTKTESEVVITDVVNAVSSSSYVETALEEKKQLHATYYFSKIYVTENQNVTAGENLLQYTNGTYMTAPYNGVITEISVPSSGEMCTNEHYITIQSTDTLKISLSVDEDEIDKITLGQNAEIEFDAIGDKEFSGYITDIASQAEYSSSGSKFDVTVELQNDGEILLGMSAKCSVILEKAENVVAVATEAIDEQNGEKYVTVKKGETETQVKVETGISNDAYTEVKSGLNDGDIVIIEKEESNTRKGGMNNGMMPGSNDKQERQGRR